MGKLAMGMFEIWISNWLQKRGIILFECKIVVHALRLKLSVDHEVAMVTVNGIDLCYRHTANNCPLHIMYTTGKKNRPQSMLQRVLTDIMFKWTQRFEFLVIDRTTSVPFKFRYVRQKLNRQTFFLQHH